MLLTGEVQAMGSLPRSVAQWDEGFGVLEDYKSRSWLQKQKMAFYHTVNEVLGFSLKEQKLLYCLGPFFFFKRGEKFTSNSDRILRTAGK